MPNLSPHQTFAMLDMTAQICGLRPDVSKQKIVSFVQVTQGLAAQLHRRYEAACSYEWANTEAYERRTEKLEQKATDMATIIPGLTVEHQRDPRGWPLIVKLDGVELGRLG